MENLFCHDLIDKFENEIENVHEVDEEEEYSVEKILDKRVNSDTGKDEYFLKWKGYSSTEGTWEPKENIFCHDLVAKFEEQIAFNIGFLLDRRQMFI